MVLGSAAFAQVLDVPYVTPGMRTADYWISRHRAPNRLVMSSEQIKAFNQTTRENGLTDDLGAFPSEYDGDGLKAQIEQYLQDLAAQRLFKAGGIVVGKAFYAGIRQQIGLEDMPYTLSVRRGVTVAFTNQRLLPTDEALYEKRGAVDFDQLQNSGLDPATPVAILFESVDKQWLYVKDGITAGWVHAKDVAFVDEVMWKMFGQEASFVVVTSMRAPIWFDVENRKAPVLVRMGAKLVVTSFGKDEVKILYPQRGVDGKAFWIMAFVRRADIARGYLPYTARTIYTQAFKMLDAPYGWGDIHQQQDCSRFTQMVFATVGLVLPRNSAEQGLTGLDISFDDGVGALTLLRLKGHVMLYLGKVDQRFYAIHAVWSYHEKQAGKDVQRALRRVVVSDLSLGTGSSKGSLLDRVVSVRFLGEKEKD